MLFAVAWLDLKKQKHGSALRQSKRAFALCAVFGLSYPARPESERAERERELAPARARPRFAVRMNHDFISDEFSYGEREERRACTYQSMSTSCCCRFN